MNAFKPATELDDPDRFAGRSLQVRELTDALHVDGSVPVIFGDRGLGKSSLALQIRRIAMGNPELLVHLKAQRLALPDDRQFLTFFVTCTDATKDVEDLLQLMVNSAESVDVVPNNGSRRGHLIDRSTRRKLSLKMFEFESTKNYQIASGRLSYQDLNLEEKLVQLCDLLSATYRQPVLFIIDELDRMGDASGLASFLKASSRSMLKFLLVGIASSVADLLHDHRSLERRLISVRLPLMTSPELGQIVVKAQNYLNERGLDVRFSEDAILRLARAASGFPWFTHVLGQQSLVDATDDGQSEVSLSYVEAAIGSVANNRFAQQFADTYQMAVRDSYNREITLRMLAHWLEADIPTGEIYRRLRTHMGITAGPTYRNHLCKQEYGSILVVPNFQKRGLVRFRNEMFKTYVRMRPSIYADVDKRVARVMKDG